MIKKFVRSARADFILIATSVLVVFSSANAEDWPMWRYDAARSNTSPQQLADKLHLQWVRHNPPLEGAWEDVINLDRMGYDRFYEPVVAGSTMYIASNRSDSVTAIDTRTGVQKWKIYADGPIRFPPVAYQGNVYFVSDDGYLYCVSGSTGIVEWKFRGGPSDKKALGNSRLVSAWCARGGPVVADGVIYFGASIWPFMGTFVHAVDTRTGRRIWTSDGQSQTFSAQPHGGANSFGYIAPQGTFAVSGDKLLVPNGRSVPACFNRHTGKLDYFYLAGSPNFQGASDGVDRKREGGAHVSAIGKFYFNHRGLNTAMYDRDTGGAYMMWNKTTYPVLTDETCYLSGESVVAYDLGSVRKETYKDSKKNDKTRWKMDIRWRLDVDATGSLIKTGEKLFAGGKNKVSAIDISVGKQPSIGWSGKIDGLAVRIIAADDRLFVVNDKGSIYAFGAEEKETKTHEYSPMELGDSGNAAEDVKEILDIAKPHKGYCIVYGIDTGEFIAELIAQSELYVIAIDSDVRKVDALRRRFDAAGIYGGKISIHTATPATLDGPAYIAVLTVVNIPEINPADAKGIFNSTRPYGGKAVFVTSHDQQRSGIVDILENQGFTGAEINSQDKYVVLTRKGALPGSADWVGLYGDAANTNKSNDKLVKAPLGLLWFGGSTNQDVLPRHGHGPGEQVVGGRLFIQGVNMMSCRDVYTGQVLWKRTFDDLGTFGIYYDKSYDPDPFSTSYNQLHIPGANARGTNFIVTEERLYLIVRDECVLLDSATGRTIDTFTLTDDKNSKATWAYINIYEDLLIAGKEFADYSKSQKSLKDFDYTSCKSIVVMDRHSGKVLWERKANQAFRHNTIIAGAGKLFCIDTTPEPVVEAMQRRGKPPEGTPALYAVDIRTGDIIWEKTDNVFGSWLGYSSEYDILLQSGRASRDMIAGEKTKRMITYRGSTGDVIWDKPNEHSGPPILHHDTIYLNALSTTGGAVSLLTGEPGMMLDPLTREQTEWVYQRFYGCNSVTGAEHLLTFRSGAAGYFNLADQSGTGNLGGFKSGCTSNLIVANGILNAPDYTRTCTCSYQNQTSLGLVYMPELETWTFNTFSSSAKKGEQIRRLGVNFGAPGDRAGTDGTLWLEYPPEGGPSPYLPVEVKGEDVRYPRRHTSAITEGPLRWVGASAAEGAQEIMIKVAGPNRMETLIKAGDRWRYSVEKPGKKWKVDLSDDTWAEGTAPLGAGYDDVATRLEKVKKVYLRRRFNVSNPEQFRKAVLKIRYDDAFVAYINGREALQVGFESVWLGMHRKISGHSAEESEEFAIEDSGQYLTDGTNILAIELHNSSDSKEKFGMDASLLAATNLTETVKYTVRLVFAETADLMPGQRVFDVAIQGKTMLEKFDITKHSERFQTIVREFNGIEATDTITIGISQTETSKLPGLISGIEIIAEN